MSNECLLTFHGHVGTPVELREGASVPWVLFRVASTPSYWDQASRSWRELPTTWLSVKAFRHLAQNVADSLQVGDPVIVAGRLRTELWATKDGEARESLVLEATSIAHDLNRGVTRFRKVDRQPAATSQGDGTAEALAELETQRAEIPAA